MELCLHSPSIFFSLSLSLYFSLSSLSMQNKFSSKSICESNSFLISFQPRIHSPTPLPGIYKSDTSSLSQNEFPYRTQQPCLMQYTFIHEYIKFKLESCRCRYYANKPPLVSKYLLTGWLFDVRLMRLYLQYGKSARDAPGIYFVLVSISHFHISRNLFYLSIYLSIFLSLSLSRTLFASLTFSICMYCFSFISTRILRNTFFLCK